MRYTDCVNEVLQQTAHILKALGNKKYLIGVSGGRDSMCLLHAVLNCGAADKTSVTVVHVNHNLRETAAADENFVRKYCTENGVRFHAASVDVRSYSADNGLTIEQAARDLRYGVFYGFIERGDADIILTAHHALDNAETILMHLFRGSGIDGLRGMGNCNPDIARKTDICASADMRKYIVRPFLNVYPTALDAYVKQFGIKYVVDETNFEDDADRNFIRLKVIPLIEQRYRGAVRAVNELSGECASVCAALDGAIDDSLIVYERGGVTVKDAALNGAIAARYVRRALEYFTTVDVTREQILRVVGLSTMRTGATAELSNGIKAAREYGGISLYLLRPFCDVEIPVALGANFIDGLAVDITLVAPPDDIKSCARGVFADFDKLEGATVRFRRDGDHFTPCGGKRKKLKQFFIDNKIPLRDRDRIPLVCKGDEVLVAVGVQISEGVKLTQGTARCACIKSRW